MARRDAGRGTEASEQLLSFSRGLYPILLRADTSAFSTYLAQWEDVIGDTAELTATPPDQLRRTMSALLRRPQQFGLPPWPASPYASPAIQREADAPVPRRPEPAPRRTEPAPRRTEPKPSGREPAPDGTEPAPRHAERDARSAESVTRAAPTDAAPPVAPSAVHRGTYQLDMLTGELVPVAAGAPGVAEPEPAPYEVDGAGAPPARKRRRRRPPRGMEQLTFFSRLVLGALCGAL